MKRSLIVLGAFLLTFSLFADWVDYSYYQGVATPEDSWGIIRLGFNSQGRLYLSNAEGQVWYTDNPLDAEPSYTLLLDEDLANGIQGIAFDADDNVYLSGDNDPDGFIAKFDSEGNEVWSYVLEGTRVTSCTLLSTGELLVTSFGGIFYLFDNYADAFVEGGPNPEWDYWWNEPPIATVEVVDQDTDWRGVLIEPHAESNGWFLKTDYDGAGWGTHGVVAENETGANFMLSAYVYLAYDDGTAVTPQLFGLWGGVVGDPYTRVQFRYRDDSHYAEESVVRVQGMAPTQTVTFDTYDDDTGPIFDGEGWYHVKASWLPGPQISIWIDGKYVGTADLTGHAAGSDGYYGLGAFSYGGQEAPTGNFHNPPQQVYWDDFKAYSMVAEHEVAGLANFVRDIDSTPADEIFAIQSGSVKAVTGGDAADLAGYSAADFGAASYYDNSWQVRQSIAYDADTGAVFSTNWAAEDPLLFIQDASNGALLQTIDDFPWSDFQTSGVAVSDLNPKVLIVSGFRNEMRVYTQITPKQAVPPFEKLWAVLAGEYDWLTDDDDYDTHSAAMNPITGNVMVAAWKDSPGLKVLSRANGSLLGELNTDGNVPRTVFALPSGKIIAAVNGATEIMVWDEEVIDGPAPTVVDHSSAISSGRTIAAVESDGGEIIVLTGDARGGDFLKYTFDGSSWSATEVITNGYGNASSIAVMEDGSIIAKWVWEYAAGTEAGADGASFAYLDANGAVVEEVTGFFNYAGEFASLDNLLMSNVVIDDAENKFIAVANYTPDFVDIPWVDFPLNVHDYVGIFNLDTGEEVASIIDPSIFINNAIQADGTVTLAIAPLAVGHHNPSQFYVTTAIQNNNIGLFTSAPEALTVSDWMLFDY